MNFRFALLLFVLCSGTTAPALATGWGWILSIPHAISGEQVYKVRIVEIDGETQQELLRYPVSPGKHEIKVRMMLQVEWEPDLAEAPRGPGVKELTLEVAAGRTYQLAARFHPDAPIEAQLDLSYWEPFVYRVD